MMPSVNQVHIDVPLSDVSIKFRNNKFVAESLYPQKMVDKISNKYWVYGKENFDLASDIRAPGTRGVEIDWSLSTSSYLLAEHAQTHAIPDQVRDNADEPLQMNIDTTEFLTEKIQLRLEYDVAAIATATSSYASGQYVDLSGAGQTQWSDGSSDPVADVEAAKAVVLEACGMEPNVLLLGHKVKIALKTHPKIIERVKFGGMGQGALVTDDILAELFEVDEILDGKALYNTAVEGETRTLNYIWGNNVILAVKPSSMGVKVLSAGAVFRMKGYRLTETWRQQPESSDYVRVRDFYQPAVISTSAGYLFQNAIKAAA